MGILATSGVLTLRGNAIRIHGEGYVRVAELRGLRDSRIVTRYIGQNSILPMYTRFMTGIAGVLSSAVIVEQIFSYPGLGMLTFTAVKTQDYPLLMGTLIVFYDDRNHRHTDCRSHVRIHRSTDLCRWSSE